ncbi:MAG: hypothetical protein HY738_06015 [Bacteroidia bacterium]|nr:hypothetical protein [Bacteroidia bacterium]
MKTIVIQLILVFFVSVSILAQTGKKTLVTGMKIRISGSLNDQVGKEFQNFDYTRLNYYSFTQQIGYYFVKNLETGVFYSVISLRDEYRSKFYKVSPTYSTSCMYNTKIVGLYFKYHKIIYNAFGFLTELEFGYGTERNKLTTSQISGISSSYDYVAYQNQTGSSFNSGIYIGFEHYIKKKLGIELKLNLMNYKGGKVTEKVTNETGTDFLYLTPGENSITISEFEFFQLPISIGIRYNILNKSVEK